MSFWSILQHRAEKIGTNLHQKEELLLLTLALFLDFFRVHVTKIVQDDSFFRFLVPL